MNPAAIARKGVEVWRRRRREISAYVSLTTTAGPSPSRGCSRSGGSKADLTRVENITLRRQLQDLAVSSHLMGQKLQHRLSDHLIAD